LLTLPLLAAAPFTPSNPVVARVGNSQGGQGPHAAAVFRNEYPLAGTLVQTGAPALLPAGAYLLDARQGGQVARRRVAIGE
jgi:hypothetical protein